MAFHHGTIRKYTAALLDLFNNVEVSHDDSLGNIITKSIPITFASREKSRIVDEHTSEQLRSGNYNVLPRASLSMSTMSKLDNRIMNKNNKINTKSSINTFEYSYNSVPYDFTFELTIICRGMNEATQIVEQIAPKFNPIVNLDIWDASNLNEPTRVPVKLLDISIETEEYDELSSNLVTVGVGLSITGNLYAPINTIERIQSFKMNINEQVNNTQFNRRRIEGWDVNDSSTLINHVSTEVANTQQYPPVLIDIVSTGVVTTGNNLITLIFNDKDNKLSELTFDWAVVLGNATIVNDLDNANLIIASAGNVEVTVTVTDIHGNFASLSKTFIVI